MQSDNVLTKQWQLCRPSPQPCRLSAGRTRSQGMCLACVQPCLALPSPPSSGSTCHGVLCPNPEQNLAELTDERDLSIVTRLGCGAFAGTFGQTVAYPLDVVRRRLQVSRRQ